jgi:putative glutamine amidotransferase
MNPDRWDMENELFGLVDPAMPILGICYGCQFLNVKRGGSLIQHLPDIVKHNDHIGGTFETFDLAGSSKLSGFAQTASMHGKSYHHQAIGRIGSMLKVVANHEDGTIEAVEDPTRPFLVGVQWHPERLPYDEANRNLFRAFVDAAKAYSKVKQ